MIEGLRSALLADAVSNELSDLAERVQAGVVEVTDGRGSGAGTIWSSDGLIVTNHHVVPGDRANVRLTDGREMEAVVVASLPARDLALLNVDADDLPALPIGDSSLLRPGEIVIAVGHPLGQIGVVTFGVFSRFGPYEGGAAKHFREGLLADIELRPGNSGGPLVNARGEVIGINSMVLGPGTAMAVPSATVARLFSAHRRRTLGVQIGIIQNDAGRRELLGQDILLMIFDVANGSNAARAGLLPGDVLLAIDGENLEEPGDLALALSVGTPDGQIMLSILRGGERREIAVTLD